MVNFSLNLASMVGIALAIGGVGLYAVRSVRPELSRDYDLFFAAVALLCGGILFFYGWRFDPIMQFGQILLGGSTIFFALENIRLRGVTTVQAKRQATNFVDEDRTPSRVYRVDAQLDELEPYDEQPIRRRIKGTQDDRASRSGYYEEEVRRRPPSRGTNYDPRSTSDRPRRRPRPTDPPPNVQNEEWEASVDAEDRAYPRRSSTSVSTDSEPRPRRRKTRPPEESTRRRNLNDDVATTSGDYVDYQPIEESADEQDNSANFDD